MLRRFADARLRAELAETRRQRNKQGAAADRLAADLAVARRDLRYATRALETQDARAGRWKSIAQQAQADLAAERARTQETNR